MTGDMLPGESTSAALRRVTAERDEARACWSTAERDLTTARAEIDRLGLSLLKSGQANAALMAAAEQAARDRDLARAELSSAREDLERLRTAQHWIVARKGGRYCERCEGEVTRGQAYEVQPGTGGLVAHIHCPPQKEYPMNQPMTVRKRPVAVEAMQYTGDNRHEVQQWMFGSALESATNSDPDVNFRIATLEGTMTVSVGDWVIKGIQGEFYPCKPDIFEATYERADV